MAARGFVRDREGEVVTHPRRIAPVVAALLVAGFAPGGGGATRLAGSPETVLPPCYVPTDVDTTGWQTLWWRMNQVLKLPPSMQRDKRYRSGVWTDGSRRVVIYSQTVGSYTCVPGPKYPGCSECVDSLGGELFRLITNYNPRDSLYEVVAVYPHDLGHYFDEFHGESPDSADQRVFLTILRTIRADSTSRGEAPSPRTPRGGEGSKR